MQLLLEVAVITATWCGAVGDLVLLQKKVRDVFNSNVTGSPRSTCSKTSGSNLYATCPQDKCYGDSACCLPTGACASFDSSICANIYSCANAPCGSSSSGFPPALSSVRPSSYHQRLLEADGCTCVKAVDACTTGACWGTMQCTGSGTCNTTNQCTAGNEVAAVGNFCMILADDPTCFKFCGWTTTTTTTTPEPEKTPEPTPEPTPVPTPSPTPEPTSEPTPQPTSEPTSAPTDATTTTTTTSCETVSCEIYGDPHISGFEESGDGPTSLGAVSFESKFASFSATGFDGHPMYLDVGDAWLIKSNQLSIQARYVPSTLFKTGGSVMGAIAMGGIALDDKRLVIEPRNGSVMWDGHSLSFGKFSTKVSQGDVTVLNGVNDLHTKRSFSRVEISLPMGVNLNINRYDSFLNVRISMPKVGALTDTGFEGQCGTHDDVIGEGTLSEFEQLMHTSDVLPQESWFS